MQEMYELLLKRIKEYKSAVLGFSGGVDSSLIAYALKDADIPYMCVTVQTPLQTEGELVQSACFCKEHDIKHKILELDVLAVGSIKSNPKDRCYYCKKNIFGALLNYAEANGYACVLDGSNADDSGEYRPGLLAKEELGVCSPLAEMGYTKKQIREISKELGLSTWDMTSSPCLATRIPYGTALDRNVLSSVAKAEKLLTQTGVADVRVRVHGELARIEAKDVKKAFALIDGEVIKAVKNCGFRFVCLDMDGYKRGCYD